MLQEWITHRLAKLQRARITYSSSCGFNSASVNSHILKEKNIVLLPIGLAVQKLQVTARREKWLEWWSTGAKSGTYKWRKISEHEYIPTSGLRWFLWYKNQWPREIWDIRDAHRPPATSIIQGTLSMKPYRRKGAWRRWCEQQLHPSAKSDGFKDIPLERLVLTLADDGCVWEATGW